VNLTPQLASRLEAYFRLLETWNRKINLTGLNLAEATPETIDRLLIEPLVAAQAHSDWRRPDA
jgi:16S rRNA G527 N7-methylase RsmG